MPKVIFELSDELLNDAISLEYMSPRMFNELKECVANGIFVPNNATSGDVFTKLFNPFCANDCGVSDRVDISFTEKDYKTAPKDRVITEFPKQWWNAYFGEKIQEDWWNAPY